MLLVYSSALDVCEVPRPMTHNASCTLLLVYDVQACVQPVFWHLASGITNAGIYFAVE